MDAGRLRTLGDLFSVWGQPLSSREMAGFRGGVLSFVNGRRWPAPPRRIRLTSHVEIVLEVGGLVPPHRTYAFPPGV